MPPFLLVHGAFHGGWCWAPVARILRARGHEVITPTLTGLGERRHLMSPAITMETFVLDVLNVIEFEQLEDIILVGHSFGARPVSGVADRVPARIRRLIFIDGGLAPDGLSKLDAMPPQAREARIQSSVQFDGGISVPPPPAQYFGIFDASIADWVNRFLTPQPLKAEQSAIKLNNPLGNGLPATYLKCTDPALPSVESSAAYARTRSDWRYRELKAGHDCIVTLPEVVADILIEESGI